MMVNTHEAKTQLSQLIERAANGEEIVLAKAGKPMARLVPYRADRSPRRPGQLRGQIHLTEDFDETPEDLIAAFEAS